MISLRPNHERGRTKLDDPRRLTLLDSHHTFAFDQYYDPKWMGFRQLRVLNEDWIKPGAGFPIHDHRDMEIITYVLEGVLEHKDSLGNRFLLHPGEVQRMTAGTGVTHSEYNHSHCDILHLFQIWILPDQVDLIPSYEQRSFRVRNGDSQLVLVASRDGHGHSILLHQDVDLHIGSFAPGALVSHRMRANRHAWVQVAHGELLVNNILLKTGDGAAVSEAELLEFRVNEESLILLFDLA